MGALRVALRLWSCVFVMLLTLGAKARLLTHSVVDNGLCYELKLEHKQ